MERREREMGAEDEAIKERGEKEYNCETWTKQVVNHRIMIKRILPKNTQKMTLVASIS